MGNGDNEKNMARRGMAEEKAKEKRHMTQRERPGEKRSTYREVNDEFGEMEMNGQVSDLVVIAPAGRYRTWVQALDDDLSDDLRKRIAVHVWSSGAGASERNRRNEFLQSINYINTPPWPRCLIMNVEALSRPGEAREFILKFLKQRKNVVAIDEVTVIKNKSKRTDFVVKKVAPSASYQWIV